MDCAIIHDSSHVTLALFSDVILVYAVFLCRFYIHASEYEYLEQWLSGGRVVLQ